MLHVPEYLIEGSLLGVFMLAACAAVVVVCHPDSPVARAVGCPVRRRGIIGVLMGLTAVALIYSPWGQRSGAHMNPAVTLAFFALGKVAPWDALFYVVAQFLGGVLGVGVARVIFGARLAHPAVRYAVTSPGRRGRRAAWIGEASIAAGMLGMVLISTNRAATAPYTGLFAGTMVAAYILLEAPISGMSMNPARTLASALHARDFTGLWIYLTAPPLGMLAAAAVYVGVVGTDAVYCAKLRHLSDGPACLFKCRHDAMTRR